MKRNARIAGLIGLLTSMLWLTGCGGDAPAPVAQNDSVVVKWNVATPLSVASNDDHPGGATLTVSSAPVHGTTTVQGQVVSYLPNPGYIGPDRFKYTLSSNGQDTQATVDVQVGGSITLVGTVTDAPLSGAQVEVMAGTTLLKSVTSGVDGTYSATIDLTVPTAFLQIKATGTGAQTGVVLSSLLGDVSSVVASLPTTALTATPTVTPEILPATKVSHVTTAFSALVQQNLGGLPATTQAMQEASLRILPGDLQTLATAIQLVADHGVSLPAGVADTLKLASDAAAVQAFVADQRTSNAVVFQATMNAVLGTGTAPPTPAAGQVNSSFTLVFGQGAVGQVAERWTFAADGTGVLLSDSSLAFHWVSSSDGVDVNFDSPPTTTAYSTDQDPVTGLQNTIQFAATAAHLVRLAGDFVHYTATVTTTYLDGSRAGQTLVESGMYPATQRMVGAPQAITAADLLAGTSWSGLWGASTGAPSVVSFAQDTLVVDDANSGHMKALGTTATLALDKGRLVVTQGASVVRYTRLFTGPWGEERWLAEGLRNGEPTWLMDTVVVKAQAGLSVSAGALTGTWRSYINQGLWDQTFDVEFNADASVYGVSTFVGSTPATRAYLGMLSVSADGDSLRVDQWRSASTGVACYLASSDCRYLRGREWRPLALNGDTLWVMEYIDSTYPPGPRPGYRINAYRMLR